MKDRVRQAKAHEILVLSARIRAWLRYWRSRAWWQGLSHRCSFDPVGEIFQPYRHRAEPVLFPVRRQGWQRTTSRGEIGKRERNGRDLQSEDPGLEVVHPHAAGIDIGNGAHYVAVRPERDRRLLD